MTDANLHPSVILIRDRLHDIFPEIEIPLEVIGWHIRQSNSIETICSNFATEILSFGTVSDPTKASNQPETVTSSSITQSPVINDDALRTLYDVFNSIPHNHIENVYTRLKNTNNPNWYDDIVNELLSYDAIKPSTNKRSFDEMNLQDEDFTDQYERLLAILPDIDPDHAFECYMKFLETSLPDQKDLNILITSLIEHGYVKLTNKLERLRNERLKENLREPKFEIEEFLKTFSNPLEYFYDRTKNVSESYKTHAYIYLANAFARLTSDYIKQILNSNNYRFAPALKQLQEEFYTYHKKKSNDSSYVNGVKRLNHRARAPISIPDIPDEIFYKELCYTKHEEEIIEYLTRKQEFRDEQIRIAQENGTLQTCDCCCDDQLLDDDMIHCDNNHRFCQTCIRNYIENGFILNGQCFFTCLNSTCKYEYSTTLMGHLLAPTLFSRLLIKIQQEELRLANIPNFEQCKYCTFGTIIDDQNERVFRCLNQECLKETCRACGEANHIPLRCDEVEKKDELDMRTFIENRVSEAMIRVCYKCKQRFYKLEGCNKMTCACGASMCYVCREPIKGYEHFNNNDKCNANDDVVKMHQEEMRLAYDEAKKAYIERHPEANDLVLKYDPQQHLAGNKSLYAPKAKRGRRRGHHGLFFNAD